MGHTSENPKFQRVNAGRKLFWEKKKNQGKATHQSLSCEDQDTLPPPLVTLEPLHPQDSNGHHSATQRQDTHMLKSLPDPLFQVLFKG